jgi:tetratricopeptide (TPR) repeat protein
LPTQALTEAILYEFLLAEIAGQRGNVGLSAQAYADLAKKTRDPRIARRATEIAIFARMTHVAAESAKVWHESDPGSTRALQTLISLLFSTARFDEALPFLKKMMVAGGPEPSEAFSQVGRTLSGVADKQAALKLIVEVAQDYPQLLAARLAVAQVAVVAGDDATASREIQRARSLRPESEAAVLLEAQIAQRRSNSEALQVLEPYLARYPGSREVRLNYARVLVAEKRIEDARSEFQRLAAAFPDNTEVIFAVALLSLQLSDYASSENYLKRLLELDFRDPNLVRLYLGQITEEQKRVQEALDWYKAVESGEQYLTARIRYAQLLSRQGQLEAARAWLQESTASSSQQRVQLILSEAQLLRDAGQSKPAFELVGGALDKQPDNPELLYDYAMLAERLDRVDLLESSLRKLISIRPDHAHAYNALGYTLADRNMRLTEARQFIEKALELSPDDAFIVDSMGWVLFRQGALDEALKYLRQAYAARPDPEIASHLAEVLWAAGDQSGAERVLKEVIDKNPGNETLMKTIKRLKP